jgi:hypothetical protein
MRIFEANLNQVFKIQNTTVASRAWQLTDNRWPRNIDSLQAQFQGVFKKKPKKSWTISGYKIPKTLQFCFSIYGGAANKFFL